MWLHLPLHKSYQYFVSNCSQFICANIYILLVLFLTNIISNELWSKSMHHKDICHLFLTWNSSPWWWLYQLYVYMSLYSYFINLYILEGKWFWVMILAKLFIHSSFSLSPLKKRFILRNWLMQSWRWGQPTSCSWQAID